MKVLVALLALGTPAHADAAAARLGGIEDIAGVGPPPTRVAAAPARPAPQVVLPREPVPPTNAPAVAPDAQDYITRLLTQPAIGGASPPAAPSPVPTRPPATRESSLPPPALRSTETPPRPPLPTPALRPTQAPAANLEGNWTAEQTSPGATAPSRATLAFARKENVLAGAIRQGTEEYPLFEVQQAGDSVSFMLVIPGMPYVSRRYVGTLMDDELMLTSLDDAQGVYMLTAHREDAAPARAVTAAALPLPPPPERLAPPDIPAPARPQVQPALPVQDARALTPQVTAPPPPQPAPAPEIASLATPPLPVVPPPTQAETIPEVAAPASAPTPQIASLAPLPRRAPVPVGPLEKLPLPALRDIAPKTVLKTPPMGWASAQRLGTTIDDEAIRQAADGLEETGLKALGFTYIEVDDGWQGARDENGALHGNEKFPDMKALGAYIHAKGLIFGLMTSAAPQSCEGYTGSYGHEAQDAKSFAEWGVDVLIYEWCGAETIYPTQAEMQAAYQKMGEALRTSGRDIAFVVSQGGKFNVASWASKTGANLWRTGNEVEDRWQSVLDAATAAAGTDAIAGAGRWRDPGLVQAGNGAMTPDEYRAQLNLWAVMGAPMVLGNDVRIMQRETVDLLANKEVLAIDQDVAGRQGQRIAQTADTEVWAKPLADGSTAVVFINRGESSASAAVSWAQLGITGPRRVRDVWWHENLGTSNNRYAVFLTGHTSLLLRLSPP